MRGPGVRAAALLLFGSGLCALAYQVAWLRLLRLVFGASTGASAAVLGLFMAGLGAGSLVLGPRADRHRRPVALYARLELGVALSAAASPWLVEGVRGVYLGLGGSAGLGLPGSTALRLVLSAVVLGLPSFLMGGTLPALARGVAGPEDRGRRSVALLYGANTLGAVTGALATTFLALEALGIRNTVLAAAGLNLLVAGAARVLARRPGELPGHRRAAAPSPGGNEDPSAALEPAPAGFLLAAAGAVGFVFFLMELVWYRMLAPLLGGSSYTFGLILALALLGIGGGGLLYSVGRRDRRPGISALAASCALEALFLAVPLALGDRIALVALLLRPLGAVSFPLLAAGWTLVASVVVLPAALVAGYQFPLIVSLLGAGRRQVGRHVGSAYAWNTAGALLGSLAGGFGLLPLLTAPGAWRLAVAVLLALAAASVVAGRRAGGGNRRLRPGRTLAPAALAVGALAAVTVPAGPTAAWRHTPIGAGGVEARFEGPNDARRFLHQARRGTVWEAEGVESSVAIQALEEVVFVLNGKPDGSARRDAPTQVLSGLIGAALHPDPRRALVIGLGTGSSAGWLARVPDMERVDVVELEPAIREVAERCAPVNHGALEDPRVHLIRGDGRELLATSDRTYDLIFSEPSNPYRAGIASLFTVEFYRTAAERLRPGGLFLQWLQGYDVDSQVVRTALATLAGAFDHVETWQVHQGDLLFVASDRPVVHRFGRAARRADREPLASALAWTLGVRGAEGLYSGFLAGPGLARAVHALERNRLNTDDRPRMEFGFVRSLGRRGLFDVGRLADLARMRGEATPQPRAAGPGLDPVRLAEMRQVRDVVWGRTSEPPPSGDPDFDARARARAAYARGELERAGELWAEQGGGPRAPLDRLLLAESLAESADPAAPAAARALGERHPVATSAVLARWHLRRGEPEAAARSLSRAFTTARDHAWAFPPLLRRALHLAPEIVRAAAGGAGRELADALAAPFAVRLLDDLRLRARLAVVESVAFGELCTEALAPFEPHVPWEEDFLAVRERCYRIAGSPRAETAARDLADFRAAAPPELVATGAPPGDRR